MRNVEVELNEVAIFSADVEHGEKSQCNYAEKNSCRSNS